MRDVERKEYHKNGELSYVETIRYISKEEYESGKYPNCREDENGNLWFRIGLNAKYFDNGIRNWAMEYDDHGNLISSHSSMRKDGSFIKY